MPLYCTAASFSYHYSPLWATGNREGNICKGSGSEKGLRYGVYSRGCHSVPYRFAIWDGILVIIENTRLSLGDSGEVTRCSLVKAGRVFRGGPAIWTVTRRATTLTCQSPRRTGTHTAARPGAVGPVAGDLGLLSTTLTARCLRSVTDPRRSESPLVGAPATATRSSPRHRDDVFLVTCVHGTLSCSPVEELRTFWSS